jgi:Spy/CpxP family protein refolding chaperone
MKKRNLIIFVVLGAVIIMGGLAACKPGFHHRGFDRFDVAAMTGRVAWMLDLTADQKVELERLAGEVAEQAKIMREERDACRQEVADLVRQDTIQPEVVDAMVAEKIAKMQTMADFVTVRLMEFHKILTPEQREKIAGQIENFTPGGFRFAMR